MSPVRTKPQLAGVMLVLAICATACGGGAGKGAGRTVAALEVVSGNTQIGVAGEELSEAVVVRVKDLGGLPVGGQVINFRVTVGGGSVFAGTAISDNDGMARERWTLGPVPGPQRLEARAVDSRTGAPIVFATFDATAVPVPGVFVATGSMTTGRFGHTATLLADGRVLATSGYSNDGDTATAELYDPVTGTFTATGSMTMARGTSHAATSLPNGKVLIVGDDSGSFGPGAAELYDPATGAFTTTGCTTTGRASPTATLLTNGKVLVAGGTSNNWAVFTSEPFEELYDPVGGTFANTGAMHTLRASHTATLLPNGMVLIAGGYSTADLATAELYDPVAGIFTITGPMNKPRRDHTATALPSGKVLIAGGVVDSIVSASAELYDPATGRFAPTGSMSTARAFFAATLLPAGTVLITGGFNGGTHAPASYEASAEVYDPELGTFAPASPMTARHWRHTATPLLDGKVLVVGGYNGYTYTPVAELWTSSP